MKSSRSSRKARKAKKLRSAERPDAQNSSKQKFGGVKEISLQNIVVRAKAQAAN